MTVIEQLEAGRLETIAGIVGSFPLPIQDVCENCLVGFKPPRKSRGEDYIQWVAIVDETTPDMDTPLSINIFRRNPTDFPQQLRVGCAIGFRDLKMNRFNSKLQGVASPLTTVLTETEALSEEDWFNMSRITSLKSWYQLVSGRSAGAELSYVNENKLKRSGARPLLSISEMKPEIMFFDIVAEVLAVYGMHDNPTTLLVCDYTENNYLPWQDRSAFRIQPRMALQCSIWDEHRSDLKGIQAGSILRITNLKCKITGNGLEAVLHGSQPHEKRITTLERTDADAKVLIERRKLYRSANPVYHENPLQHALLAAISSCVPAEDKTPKRPIFDADEMRAAHEDDALVHLMSDNIQEEVKVQLKDDLQFITLKDIQTLSNEQLPNLFLCRAVMKDRFPDQLEIVMALRQCLNCGRVSFKQECSNCHSNDYKVYPTLTVHLFDDTDDMMTCCGGTEFDDCAIELCQQISQLDMDAPFVFGIAAYLNSNGDAVYRILDVMSECEKVSS